MTAEELADRLARLDEQMSQTQIMFAQHIRDEELQFAEIAKHVKELRDVFVGAKGALKVGGWIVAGLASAAAAWSWIAANFAIK